MGAYRWWATHPLTGEWLNADLPVETDEVTWTLNAPGSARLTLPATAATAHTGGRPILDIWATMLTALHPITSDPVWAGIVTRIETDDNVATVEVTGPAALATGSPYTGPRYERTDADPAAIITDIWAWLQQQPGRNINARITATATPARVGTPATTDPETGDTIDAAPYTLDPTAAPDLGKAIDDLTADTPLQWRETVTADAGHPVVGIEYAHPTIGADRTHLVAAPGVNIVGTPVAPLVGDDYASDILAIGAGEGEAMVTATATATTTGGRIRRTHVLTRKDETRRDALTAAAHETLRWRLHAWDIATVTLADHPHAPHGSYAVGDTITCDLDLPLVGRQLFPARVRAITHTTDGLAALTITREEPTL